MSYSCASGIHLVASIAVCYLSFNQCRMSGFYMTVIVSHNCDCCTHSEVAKCDRLIVLKLKNGTPSILPLDRIDEVELGILGVFFASKYTRNRNLNLYPGQGNFT